MPQILRTTRSLPKETVDLERFLALDGQGRPSYESPVAFEANVLEYDVEGSKGEQFVVDREGSRVRTPLTLYVEGDATDVPQEGDRIRLQDGRAFIVAERKVVSGLRFSRSQPDHYRLRCRVE